MSENMNGGNSPVTSPRSVLKTRPQSPGHHSSKSVRFGEAVAELHAEAHDVNTTGANDETLPETPVAAAKPGSVAARAAMFQNGGKPARPPLSPVRSGGHARSQTTVSPGGSPTSSAAVSPTFRMPVKPATEQPVQSTSAKSVVKIGAAQIATAKPNAVQAVAARPVVKADVLSTDATQSTPTPPPASPPHRRTRTVMERAKAFDRDPDEAEEQEQKAQAAAREARLSLKALAGKAGGVSGLRERLAAQGFDPTSAPPEVKDMIARGGKGQVKGDPDDSQDEDTDASDNESAQGSVEQGSDDDASQNDSEEGSEPEVDPEVVRIPSHKKSASVFVSSPSSAAGKGHARTKTGGFGQASGLTAPPKLTSPSAKKKAYPPGSDAAAVKLQTLARVVIARSAVRRKLVSEVTAFSMIMEKGIQMVKHPFGSRARPKKITLSIVSRRGVMQLAWGGRSAIPLSSIYGVVKGVDTTALRRSIERDTEAGEAPSPEHIKSCYFSLLIPSRTLDFEVSNPWLTLLIVRAMRLFLGAHYETIAAARFFSPVCLIPATASPRAKHARHGSSSLVWTASDAGSKALPKAEPPTSAGHADLHMLLSPHSDDENTPFETSPLSASLPAKTGELVAANLKGRTFTFMALPGTGSPPGSPSAKDKSATVSSGAPLTSSAHGSEPEDERHRVMSNKQWRLSFSISAGYKVPEDEEEAAEDKHVAADLNDKLRCLRKMVGPGEADTAVEAQAASSAASPSKGSSFLSPLLATAFFTEALSPHHHASKTATGPNSPYIATAKPSPAGDAMAGSGHHSWTPTAAELTGSGRGFLLGSAHGALDVHDPDREKKKHDLMLSRSQLHSAHPKSMHLAQPEVTICGDETCEL